MYYNIYELAIYSDIFDNNDNKNNDLHKTIKCLPYNHDTGKYRVGLDAFTYKYDIKGLFWFSIFILILGLISTIFFVYITNKNLDKGTKNRS